MQGKITNVSVGRTPTTLSLHVEVPFRDTLRADAPGKGDTVEITLVPIVKPQEDS